MRRPISWPLTGRSICYGIASCSDCVSNRNARAFIKRRGSFVSAGKTNGRAELKITVNEYA